MRSIHKRIGIASFVLVLLTPELALSYSWTECHGEPVKWKNNRAEFQIDECSIPNGSTKASDIIYSFQEWNNVYGMYDVFSWTFGSPECNEIDHNNGINEIFYAPSSEMDDTVGFTTYQYDSYCIWWFEDQHFTEADIAINGDFDFEFGNPPCNTYKTGSRTTILHEMGHALGLEHYNDKMNLMMKSDGEGKYCGSRAVTPHGDDAAGGRFLYGSGNVSHDIAASSFYYVGNNNVALNSSSSTVYLCPGDSYNIRTSVGNLGTENETFDIRWYLSTNNTITNFDILLGTNTNASIDGEDFFTFWRTVFIPSNVNYGQEYFVGYFVDWNENLSERYESNNSTYLPQKIKIKSKSQCP